MSNVYDYAQYVSWQYYIVKIGVQEYYWVKIGNLKMWLFGITDQKLRLIGGKITFVYGPI